MCVCVCLCLSACGREREKIYLLKLSHVLETSKARYTHTHTHKTASLFIIQKEKKEGWNQIWRDVMCHISKFFILLSVQNRHQIANQQKKTDAALQLSYTKSITLIGFLTSDMRNRFYMFWLNQMDERHKGVKSPLQVRVEVLCYGEELSYVGGEDYKRLMDGMVLPIYCSISVAIWTYGRYNVGGDPKEKGLKYKWLKCVSPQGQLGSALKVGYGA